MDDLKFPDWSGIPPQKNRKLSMDEYYEFVMFCRRAFPPTSSEYRSTPAPVRFVIHENDEPYSGSPHKA